MDKAYIETVRLLLETAPVVFKEPYFALKGGTAINLFVADMPRLSVDIDVVYSDHAASREEALKTIASALDAIKVRLATMGMESDVTATKDGEELKLLVRRGRSQVKIEVNHVFRGTVLPVQTLRLAKEARAVFTTELSLPTLATAELYGSKLVAAMDRQHPRDIFDVKGMYARFGLTAEIVESFVCYLAGHNRPVHEVLFSRETDIKMAFENEFAGMTRDPVTFDELQSIRSKLRRELPVALTRNHREFLLGLVSGEPDWSLMSCSYLSELPAIRWKVQNLAKLKKSNPRKFAQQAAELRARFEA